MIVQLYINGSSVAGTNTNTLTFGTMDHICILTSGQAHRIDGQGNVYQAILFPTRLTNDQLEELTK